MVYYFIKTPGQFLTIHSSKGILKIIRILEGETQNQGTELSLKMI